jgi:uncharacterized membrane protein YcaP (DUF421 family)
MEIVLRAAATFFFLLLVMRAMGKKELSQLTAFELIVLITMGDLVQQGVTQEDQSLTGAFSAVGVFALLVVLLSVVQFRWTRTRKLIRGMPVIVVRDGRPLTDVMKLERLKLEELQEGAREQGIGDLADVRVAVLEPDGKLSFIQASPEKREEQVGAPDKGVT